MKNRLPFILLGLFALCLILSCGHSWENQDEKITFNVDSLLSKNLKKEQPPSSQGKEEWSSVQEIPLPLKLRNDSTFTGNEAAKIAEIVNETGNKTNINYVWKFLTWKRDDGQKMIGLKLIKQK